VRIALCGRLGWTGNQLTGLGFGIALAASAAVETGFNGWAALPERESVAACRTLG